MLHSCVYTHMRSPEPRKSISRLTTTFLQDTSTLGYLPDPPSLPFAPPRRRGWGRDYVLHLSLFWCSDLPQRVQWGFPTEPGAASFTVDRLSDLTAVSRLLDCGLLEGLLALARWATVCCHLATVRSALL